MEQFKHFPHKWALGANVIIKIVKIFAVVTGFWCSFFVWLVGVYIIYLVLVFIPSRPASPVTVEITNQLESAYFLLLAEKFLRLGG